MYIEMLAMGPLLLTWTDKREIRPLDREGVPHEQDTVHQQLISEECRLLGCYVVWLLFEPTFGGTYRLHHQDDKNR
jgi:hypothetical protein